ncbi:hypothetical protein IGI04_032468 [Brassica rapa subsp. trilocularis]|uniref:Protein kinase domain-containing protein n=1 Tax=Brassica rapa subsp. trilocularis TaxID=1813537 RepID=A0ABQ7LXC2_BRACM|nr:hypothetical protein IGI04_032468 [Brassica rapa subsp. trilocularis]
MGMDLADKENTTSPLLQFRNCYKVASLTETILNPLNVSNLRDRYVLGEQLGWGQFGVIRVCSDKLTGERLACKSISKDRLVTQDDMKSIKLEIAIMTKLSGHPHVVDLKAVYEEEDYVHLVMELCAGGELFHKLEKYGRYSEVRARVLFKHLMQVVKFCHDNGEKLSGTVGSPFYIAPEVLSGGYNEAADVWSAGVILYILLSGVPPFWGKTKSKIFDAVRAADLRFSGEPWDRITSHAKDLIRGMLCVDPSQRLSADDVLAHSWMEEVSGSGEEQYDEDGVGCEGLENGGCSFSTGYVSREQDYSFNMGQLEPLADNDCRSSFSSFLPADSNNVQTASGFGGFSFDGEQLESTSVGFSSSRVPSMPSFSFFSPSLVTTEKNNVHETDGKLRGSSSKRLLPSPDASSQLERGEEGGENQTEAGGKAETRRERGNWARMSGLHSKRNRTIGLGELDQLVVDVAVTESIIRWASCTHIPTAPSLRLSLVC